jgi:hypothetical protein
VVAPIAFIFGCDTVFSCQVRQRCLACIPSTRPGFGLQTLDEGLQRHLPQVFP